MSEQEPRPKFSFVLRGYDKSAVDEYLASLSNGTTLADPVFPKVMRGYDMEQVDAYIARLMAWLREQSQP